MTLHHPADTTLLAAAAGSLPPLHRQVLYLHANQCPACRKRLHTYDAIGGAVLDDMAPVMLSDGALARTLQRIDTDPDLPAPVRAGEPSSLLGAMAEGSWRWLAPGIQLKVLARRDATDTRLDLIRVAPGTALPQHDHTGDEIAYVVQGAYRDATGEYHAGDIAEGEPGLDHAPVALPGMPCICVTATTGRLRARSRIARFMQSVLDI